MRVELDINNAKHAVEVEPRLSLLDCLRDNLLLTGAHAGCEHGVCGACTVLIDGRSGRSCLTFAVQMNGRTLTTVEGLNVTGGLSPLQQAFQDHHGLQCGFCTSGILMSLTELLSDNPDPTEQEVRETLTGHLCRCTGYAGPVRAALATAEQLKNIKGAA